MSNMKLRLKLVATVDFRHGIPFHVDELKRKRKLPELSSAEVMLLISATGLQLAFVFRPTEMQTGRPGHEKTSTILTHVRVQLDRHTPWHPAMLQTYAEKAGMELEGIRRFEEWFTDEYGVPDSTIQSRGAIVRALRAA